MHTANPRQAPPRLESLEDRLTPSSYIYNGDLVLLGTGTDDIVTVNVENWGGTTFYKVIENGVTAWHYASSLYGGDVYFHGYGGNDFFFNGTYLSSYAYGYGGNDTLFGGYGRDYLDGGADSDTLLGMGGNDTLMAGLDFASNTLYGMDGDDELTGGYSGDWLYGDAGRDTLNGLDGPDYLFGGTGFDTLYGGWGMDWLDGGKDGVWDQLYGEGDVDFYYQDWQYFGGFGWFNIDGYETDFNSDLNAYVW